MPLLSLARWLVRGTSTTFPAGDLSAAACTTIGLAIAGGLLATVAALPVAWLAVRHRGVLATLIERSVYPANALPGIVVALALVTVVDPLVPGALPDRAAAASSATASCSCRAPWSSVRATLELAPPVLDDVACSLGCTPAAAARRVTLPLVLPGLGASLALVSLAVSTELTATLLLVADRHLDAGHGVLVARLRGRVRRRGAVRLAADRALGARDLAALARRQPRRPAQPVAARAAAVGASRRR